MIGLLRAALIPAMLLAGDSRLASELRPGMQLVYASEGRDQVPWVVELTEPGAALKRRRRLRPLENPPIDQAAAEERLYVERDVLYAWSERSNDWVPQRPLGPHMELMLPRANGDTVRYATGEVSEQLIGRLLLKVIETIVTTTDAAGRPKRLLTERYAITLGTATGGRFEAPDSDTPGAWRTEQILELREIR